MAKRTDRMKNTRGNGPVVSYVLQDVDRREVKEYQLRKLAEQNIYRTKGTTIMARKNTGRNIKVRGVKPDYSIFIGANQEPPVKNDGLLGMVEYAVAGIGEDAAFDFGEDFTAVVPMNLSLARKVAKDLKAKAQELGWVLTASHEGDEDKVREAPTVWCIVTRKLTDEEVAALAETVEEDEEDEEDE